MNFSTSHHRSFTQFVPLGVTPLSNVILYSSHLFIQLALVSDPLIALRYANFLLPVLLRRFSVWRITRPLDSKCRFEKTVLPSANVSWRP